MSHEIEQHDGLVLHRDRAWHGLGTIVKDAPTPVEALEIAGLDWEVKQADLFGTIPSTVEGQLPLRYSIPTHKANVRMDTDEVLAVVGDSYVPFQNRQLAEFATAIASEGKARCDTAGSIRNGRKVWFLLKTGSFEVGNGDKVESYVLVSNGHDGGTAVRVTFTNIRVVCSNTLHAVIPTIDTETGLIKSVKGACWVGRHSGLLADKVESAKEAISQYFEASRGTQRIIEDLSKKPVDSNEFKQFFLEAYSRDFDRIVADPKTEDEVKASEKAQDAFIAVEKRFEDEKSMAGTTLWNAMNAYTGWVQNDRVRQYSDPDMMAERTAANKLFGDASDRTQKAFAQAVAAL